MKCISRSTLGVVIGILNVVIYVLATIVSLTNIVKINAYKEFNQDEIDELYGISETEDRRELTAVTTSVYVIVLIVCLIMALISTLLIVGIVKKRHTFMAPWVVLSIIGFVISCFRGVVLIIIMFATPTPFSVILYVFAIICFVLGLQAFIIYPIYTLYRDIRNQNNERPGQTLNAGTTVGFANDYPVKAPYYTPVPEKA